ncbi:hypothetical protein T484DRAFT_1747006 [Baffinella frigidus]|nr:hypothetical protein T484DRAFT_1747006 [Cryptophyta sp. CCMP2293]
MDVESFLRKLCDTTFEGGRVVRGDSDTIVLYDVLSWPGARTDALRQRFPHCDVDVHQAQNSSASGFVVVVSMHVFVTVCTTFVTVLATVVAALFTGFAAMHVSLAQYPDWGDMDLYDTLNESCTNETL